MICKIPEDEGKDTYELFSPKPHQIREFLVTNKHVITNTNKNLGLVVSEQTWLIEKCLELLNDNIDPLTMITKVDLKNALKWKLLHHLQKCIF